MPTPPDATYPQYQAQRWRVRELVPLAQQLLLGLELPYIARTSLGTWRWFGLSPFPVEWAEANRDESPRGYAKLDEALEGQSERTAYFDPVRRAVTPAPLGAGEHTFELVRVRCPGHAIAVIERIATWLRYRPESTVRPFSPVELWDNADTSPWPFPIVVAGVGELTVEWLIIRQRVPDSHREPNFVFQATPAAIPADTVLVGPWDDGRFWWNNAYSPGAMKWLTGSRSVLRFFCTVKITAGLWWLEVGGRLSGFTQSSGALGAAITTTTTR